MNTQPVPFEVTAAALEWFWDNGDWIDTPATLPAIVNQYRYSSRCEHDHPDWFEFVDAYPSGGGE